MPHKIKDPNPLNLFGIRRLSAPARHLEYITFPLQYNLEEAVVRWIEDNLKGRYYLDKTLETKSVNLKIGFEDPKELSYFNLACPHLKY